MQLETLFTEMADALRTKEETTSKISAESFPQRIKDLKVLDTTDSTATADDLLLGRIAYANGKRIIGTILNNGELEYTPSHEDQIIPSGLTSGGVVKAIDSQEIIVNPSTEEQLKEGLFRKVTVKAIETEDLEITPSTKEQNFTGLFKNVTVEAADAGLDTSDATATAEDILLGKTAYVKGQKVEGTLINDNNAAVNTTIPEGTAQKSGVLQAIKKVVGVSSGASARYLFYNCSALEELEFDAKNVTGSGAMMNFCGNCTSLKKLTIKNTSEISDFSGAFIGCSSLETTLNIDTSSGKRFNAMYRNCTNLKNVIPFNINTLGDNTAAVHQNLFSGCTNLSDEALNNILLMCTNAPLAPVKSLSNLGLTSTQTTKCQSLSNYQAFLDAGWTV